MRPQDLELMHKVWLDITSDPKYCGAHHYHIVALALEELRRELNSDQRADVLAKLLDEMHRRPPETSKPTRIPDSDDARDECSSFSPVNITR